MADRALDIVGVVNDLRARLARVEALGAARWGAQQSAWQTPTLAGTWANFGAPWQTARYRAEGATVRMEGLVAGSTTGTTVLTLPAEFRSPAGLIFPAVVAIAGSQIVGRLELTAAGVVSLVWAGGGSAQFASLDVTFSTT